MAVACLKCNDYDVDGAGDCKGCWCKTLDCICAVSSRFPSRNVRMPTGWEPPSREDTMPLALN